MKKSIVVSLVVASVSVCPSWADSGMSAPTSTTLAWNRIALEAVERAKPTQHQAARTRHTDMLSGWSRTLVSAF